MTLALPPLASLALLATSPATARDWPDTAGWDVVEGDDYCAIHLEYEGKGETELMVGLRTDGNVWVGLSNANWSIAKGDKVNLSYSLNGTVYSGGDSVGVKSDSSYKPGFAAKFGPDFLNDFATSSYLIVRRGDVIVDNLSLKGSAAALGTARRCLAAVKRDIAAAEAQQRRFADIADDPFAKPAAPASAAPAPQPIVPPVNWFMSDDYPAAAKRAGAQGTVAYELDVDATGAVTACRITASSGNADLDAATCATVTRRGRFRRGTPGRYANRTRWTLNDN